MNALTNAVYRMWNVGICDRSDVDVQHGSLGVAIWDDLEAKLGCKSLTMAQLLYGVDTQYVFPITDSLRRQHLGLEGAGLQLRNIIKEANK